MSFYWKVSCESGGGYYYDYLAVWVDSDFKGYIDGEVDWTRIIVTVPAGIHTITWQYLKDDSVSAGSDCGWVDKVVYNRGGAGPAVQGLLLLN